MAAMKENGKLKSYLSGCTYGEAISRISQVERDQDITALKELQVCHEQHNKVGLRYAEALKMVIEGNQRTVELLLKASMDRGTSETERHDQDVGVHEVLLRVHPAAESR